MEDHSCMFLHERSQLFKLAELQKHPLYWRDLSVFWLKVVGWLIDGRG